VVAAKSLVVLSVTKLPNSVKNGLDGSKRPRMTLPHMHSSTGLPKSSRAG
jgi:hypothetical protein